MNSADRTRTFRHGDAQNPREFLEKDLLLEKPSSRS